MVYLHVYAALITAKQGTFKQSTRRSDDFTLTPEAKKQIEEVRKQYEGTAQWLKAPNGKDTNLTEQQWLAVRTPNFIRWFGEWLNDPANASKVVDENGEPKVVYHGTGRADRVGSVFDPKRATSGPMAYFTDSRPIAENYSRNKSDTSISREDLADYRNRFVVEEKGRKGNAKPIKLIDYWSMLSRTEQARIAAIAPTINYNDDYEIVSIPNNKRGAGAYDWHIQKNRGNHFAALIEEWLLSGNLFGEEEKFLDILKLVGVANVNMKQASSTMLDIIKYSDNALYHAKDSGRDAIFAFQAVSESEQVFRRVTAQES